MNRKLSTYLFFATLLVVLACTKDKVETPCPEPEPTKWQLIAGDYKVYDTLGVFLYDMSISHSYNEVQNDDSLTFENFDGEYTFSERQLSTPPSNFPMHINLGSHDTLFDSQGNRWKLGAGVGYNYNQLIDDTIRLWFQKTNINYYIMDLVPYFSCDCKQVAVKQH